MADMPKVLPEANVVPQFLDEIVKAGIDFSIDGLDRFERCHGQSLDDIDSALRATFKKIPDIVLWPVSHEECEKIVRSANKHNVAIIPYGGGTSVSKASTTPQDEFRSIAVVDTTQMNRLLWLNKEDQTACFEAGILGQDLERTLRELGYTMGHEPDSYEFSSLGGWVATRASGLKRSLYGNIEDMVVQIKMVTCKGTMQIKVLAPRYSCGPQLNELIIGSEGTLGLVTEVVVIVRPVPEVQKFSSIVFPTFEDGVDCMRDIAQKQLTVASIRLLDNDHTMMGMLMRPDGLWMDIVDWLKFFYLKRIAGLDLEKICIATLLFEGDAKQVAEQERKIYEVAKKYRAINGGPQNGEKGYLMTFLVGYARVSAKNVMTEWKLMSKLIPGLFVDL
jgi:alkyldihydroxyacetonephosphate synthase